MGSSVSLALSTLSFGHLATAPGEAIPLHFVQKVLHYQGGKGDSSTIPGSAGIISPFHTPCWWEEPQESARQHSAEQRESGCGACERARRGDWGAIVSPLLHLGFHQIGFTAPSRGSEKDGSFAGRSSRKIGPTCRGTVFEDGYLSPRRLKARIKTSAPKSVQSPSK